MSAPERRHAPRVRAYWPVRLHKPSSPAIVETLTKDLSLDGLRCLSPTWFPVSSDLSVELAISDGDEPITVMGRTVWFRVVPHGDQFEVGLSFHDMVEKSKRRLSAYIDRLAVKSTIPPA